jgi:hypothetical protein
MSTRHQSLAACGFQVPSFSFLSNSDKNGMWFTYPAFSIYLHMDKNRRIPQQEIQIFWEHGTNVIPISQKVCCYKPLFFMNGTTATGERLLHRTSTTRDGQVRIT